MKPYVVFVCGPDKCCKTKIVKKLARALAVPAFKASSERSNFVGRSTEFLPELRFADPRIVDFLAQTKHSVVFDRGYPCEYVYSKVLERVTDQEALWKIDEGYAKLGAVVIICHRLSYKGIVDDLRPDLLTEHVLEDLDSVYTKFQGLSKCRSMRVAVDDGKKLNEHVEDVVSFLKRCKNDAKRKVGKA